MEKAYQCRRVRLKETPNQKDLMILSNPEHFSLVFVLPFLVHGLNKCNQILINSTYPSIFENSCLSVQFCANVVMNLCSNLNPFNYSNSGAFNITNVECLIEGGFYTPLIRVSSAVYMKSC